MRFNEKNIFLVVLSIVTGAILIDAGTLRDDVSLVPRVIGYPLFLLCLIATILEFFPTLATRISDVLPQRIQLMFQSSMAPADEDTEEQEVEDPGVAARYVFLGWVSGAILLAYMIGMLWASGIAMFVWVKFFAGKGWILSVVLAIGCLAFVYGLFVVGFSYEYFLRPVLPWWRI